MREQRVECVDHGLHFQWQRRGDAAVLPAAHCRDRTPDMAQRPQAVKGLERREDDEAEPEQRKAGDQRLPHRADLRIERLARLRDLVRSEEHTSELQSLMRISYAVFCLKKKKKKNKK